jgi:hypothetical protein
MCSCLFLKAGFCEKVDKKSRIRYTEVDFTQT